MRLYQPRPVNKPRTFLTYEEVQSLLTKINDPRDKALFTVMFWHGLRASEPGTMLLEHVNLKDRRIFTPRKKRSRSKWYPMFEEEEKVLRRWIKVRGNDEGPLFPSQKSNSTSSGIARHMVGLLFKKYGRMAGIYEDKLHPHSLKHGIATFLVRRGENLKVIQDFLGHASLTSTIVYLQTDETIMEELRDRIETGVRGNEVRTVRYSPRSRSIGSMGNIGNVKEDTKNISKKVV